MRVKLLAKHVIGDREWPVETIMELPEEVAVTPLMQGLDAEATAAIVIEKKRVFPDGIERPMDNPPVPPLRTGGPPR